MKIKHWMVTAAALAGLVACDSTRTQTAPSGSKADASKKVDAPVAVEPADVEFYTANRKFSGAKVWLTTSTGRSSATFPEKVDNQPYIKIANPGNMRGGYTIAVKTQNGDFVRFAKLNRTTEEERLAIELLVSGFTWSGYKYLPKVYVGGSGYFPDQFALSEKIPYRPDTTDKEVRPEESNLTPYTPR